MASTPGCLQLQAIPRVVFWVFLALMPAADGRAYFPGVSVIGCNVTDQETGEVIWQRKRCPLGGACNVGPLHVPLPDKDLGSISVMFCDSVNKKGNMFEVGHLGGCLFF